MLVDDRGRDTRWVVMTEKVLPSQRRYKERVFTNEIKRPFKKSEVAKDDSRIGRQSG